MSNPTSLYLDQEDLTRRLLDLTNRTGYEILQKHGQRIYGGPPPGWTGPQPDKGTEVYCYRIPRDCFEDELVPVFASVGQIYELRLMIEFSGTNRSYCYVRYTTQEGAREAIKKLNHYKIRPGHPLAVTRSVDNRKLSIKTVPELIEERKEEMMHELSTVVEGVEKVRFQARGWIEVEFSSHRQAALARRQLVPGNLVLFDKITVKQVDWADPEIDRTCNREGNVIVVGNIPYSTPEYLVANMLNRLSGGQVTNVVKTGSMMLVTFVTHEAAVLAMERSKDMELGGATLELSWQSNRRVDRGFYSSIPRVQYSGGQNQGNITEKRYYDNSVQGSDMMALLAQRNMMAVQLASQMSRPPPTLPYYNLPETFSGLSLAQGSGQTRHRTLNQPRTSYSSPGLIYPVPPPVTSQAYTMPVTQDMPSSTLSLFPSTTTSSSIPKPVLAVPPVYRVSGDSQYY